MVAGDIFIAYIVNKIISIFDITVMMGGEGVKVVVYKFADTIWLAINVRNYRSSLGHFVGDGPGVWIFVDFREEVKNSITDIDWAC